MKSRIFSLFIIYYSLFIVPVSLAQVIHVPGDYTTIQAAVDAAGYGDTVLVDQGRYIENVIIQGNAKAITLASNYIFSNDTSDIVNTIIDASQPQNPNYGMGVLLKNIDTVLMPKITGFTITGGTGYYKTYGGGVHCTGAIPVIEHNIIEDCSLNTGVGPSGAGIRVGPGVWDTTKVCIIRYNTVRNCAINCVSNTIEGVGAGISLGGIHSIIEENKIINNTITGTSTAYANGAGIFYYMWTPFFHPYVVVKNNEVSNNTIESWDASGGGILLTDEYGMTEYVVQGNLISGNECVSIGSNGDAKGGGIYIYNAVVSSVISDNIISGNIALMGPPSSQPYGGGIYIEGVYPQAPESNVTFERNRITGNTAYYGGGMICVTTGVNMINNFISGNQAVMFGGGIYFNGSSDTGMVAQFINNTITSNSVIGQGGQAGGMMINGDMKVLLLNDLFYGNQAETSDELRINANTMVQVQNCDINTDEITGTWTGENNFYADPQFVDEMTWDCFNHEAPCSEAGASQIYAFGEWFEAPEACIMGNARPQDEFVDVGACEVKMCWVGVPEPVGSSQFAVSIYPNPTSGSLQFAVLSSQEQHASLKVYDMHGREVAVVLDEVMPAGEQTVEFDLSGLPAGTYFYRLSVNGQQPAVNGKIVKL